MYQSIIPITGFIGYYVTRDGQILHIIDAKLSPVPTHKVGNSSYNYIHLQRDGKLYHRAVDRIVLTAYIGKHDTYHIVRHADGDIHNNIIDNLSWAPHAACQTCAAFGELCRNYANCKILQGEREARKAAKPPTPAKAKLKARMEQIAAVANTLDDAQIKPSLIDIIEELRTGKLPNDVHATLLERGRTITVQYINKVMRMIEHNDPRLYKRKKG